MNDDLTTTADADLQRLMDSIRVEQMRRITEKEQEEASLQAQIAGAVDTLTGLLGPVGATKPTMENLLAGRVSIREVGAFSPAELATQPGLALSLILKGLESVVATQIAQAQVQSRAL